MISTGIKKLDNLLDGGIKSGIITDIYGPSGTGKTQLAMQISINSLQNGGKILFLDTSGGFRPERMLEIIKSKGLDSTLLDNVIVARVTNTSEQIKFLTQIKDTSFSLIVIDNITDLFSFEFSKVEQELEKRSIFMNYMRELSMIAIEKKIPIIITNIVRRLGDMEIENLDNSISVFTHQKIKLDKNGKNYNGEIKPNFLSDGKFSYIINKSGLIDSS